MAVADFLADTSALARSHHGPVDDVLRPMILQGRVAICGMTALEMLYSVRNATEHARSTRSFAEDFEWLGTEDEDFRRAIEVQQLLARAGQHRSVALPDLLLAAVAERHRVTVLHYDHDFDAVAAVTGQAVQWVVPRGSAD